MYLSDNLKVITRRDIENAFEQLSDELHLPFANADVIKFHFGKNISLQYDEGLYLPYLGQCSRYAHARLEQPMGLNYKIRGQEFCIYDKIKAIQARTAAAIV